MRTRRHSMSMAPILFALLPLLGATAAPAASTAGTWTPMGPQGNVLALATGEPGVVYSSVSTKGIFRSSDGGATWTSAEQGSLPACLSPSWDAFTLATDPQSPATLYAGTFTGLFKTADSGASWQPAFPLADPLGAVGQVVPVPGTPGRLLAIVGNAPIFDPPFPPCFTPKDAAVDQTDNGGATWSGLALPAVGYANVTVDPAHPSRVFMGTLVPSAAVTSARAQVLELEDAVVVRTLPDLPPGPFPGALVLRVDPTTTPSTLFVVAGGYDRGIYRAVPPLGGSGPSPFWKQAAGGLPAGATVSDLALDPNFPGTLHAATSAGVFVSHDRGDSWAAEGTGLPIGVDAPPLSVLAVDPRPFGPLYAGTLGGGVYLLTRAGCPQGDAVSCLNGSRFQVGVTFQLAGRPAGRGHAVPLTEDTSAFWFFGPSALELLVKVIDGHAVNGDYWVFSGGLSDVDYTLTITDLLTGAIRAYPKPAGRLSSFADVSAFPALGAAQAHAALSIAGGSGSSSGPLAAESLRTSYAPEPASRSLGTLAATSCASSGTTGLCLVGSRFQVEISFQAAGFSGNGQAVPLTDDTGAFWFLSPANLELAVKVLDGRAVNGHFWVFYGALTDFKYTVTITDTFTGATRTYTNPSGRLASFADTSAF
jgi:hypothetical protein